MAKAMKQPPRADDKRVTGVSQNPRKVAAASAKPAGQAKAAGVKLPKRASAGRPKKVR